MGRKSVRSSRIPAAFRLNVTFKRSSRINVTLTRNATATWAKKIGVR
jgi:hypothetical protein